MAKAAIRPSILTDREPFHEIQALLAHPSPGQPRQELLLEDGLHMNADGYQIWNLALEPLLK